VNSVTTWLPECTPPPPTQNRKKTEAEKTPAGAGKKREEKEAGCMNDKRRPVNRPKRIDDDFMNEDWRAWNFPKPRTAVLKLIKTAFRRDIPDDIA
jgi:hypothetical protein